MSTMPTNADLDKIAQRQQVPPMSRSLARKVAEIMSAVTHVPKAGHNEHFKYNFAQEVDVLAAVRPEMAKRNLAMLPNVTAHNVRTVQGKNGVLHVTDLVVVFTLMDGDSGEERTVTVVGQGEDNHDKGANKALTAAAKYALLKLFLIPTGADPDADAPAEEVPRATSAARPTAASAPARADTRPASGASFPFGKNKGQSIHGAALKDLQWFAKVTRESLADPNKERYRAANSTLLGALEAEISRQTGGPALRGQRDDEMEPPPPGDEDAPF